MDTAVRRQPRKAAGGGGSRKAVPLAGALDINYTCWNSHPTFVFKCVLSIITVRSEAKEQRLRIESRKWSTGAARTREKGVVGVSLACVPQLITCTKREARHVIV